MISPTPASLGLHGRSQAALLLLPSVAHATQVLASRCTTAWVQLAVTTLDHFRASVVGAAEQLEDLLVVARTDPGVAVAALATYAADHADGSAGQLEALAFGAKTWLALNGVSAPWRSLRPPAPVRSGAVHDPGEGDLRLLLRTMVGTGLSPEVLTSLRLADVGSLTADGDVVADVQASPLAVRYPDPSVAGLWRLTFLPFHAFVELASSQARRVAAGERLDADSLFISGATVDTDGTTAVEAARRYQERLAEIDHDVATSATDDFAREWELPTACAHPRTRAGSPGHARQTYPAPHPRSTVSMEDSA